MTSNIEDAEASYHKPLILHCVFCVIMTRFQLTFFLKLFYNYYYYYYSYYYNYYYYSYYNYITIIITLITLIITIITIIVIITIITIFTLFTISTIITINTIITITIITLFTIDMTQFYYQTSVEVQSRPFKHSYVPRQPSTTFIKQQ